MFRKMLIVYGNKRKFSVKAQLDPSLKQNFVLQEHKPRKHPGVTRLKIASLPPDIESTILNILEDNRVKSFYQDCVSLNNYLTSRLPPPEQKDIDTKAEKIHKELSAKNTVLESMSPEEQQKHERDLNVKVFNILKTKVYRWANINYDDTTALQYLTARSAAEYAVLLRIFDDINHRLPDYKPQSFFDFGSGIGTGTWAINHYWEKHIFEYFCVDTSSAMHDLSRLILCKGQENVTFPFKGYFQRQFLPASHNLKYSVVLSAYTLLELPNLRTRIETLQKLWNKTEDFLIIVEQGTNAGFQLVNEARDFLLNVPKGRSSGYVFAPCPSDYTCPRFLEQKTPCNFFMKYNSLPFPSKSQVFGEVFSYVVLKKGDRPPKDPQWPRIVRAPIVRSGHTICRLCTSSGELKEVIFSKAKYDKITYRCARSSLWGDLLPVVTEDK